MASASSSKGNTTASGPKTSSRQTGAEGSVGVAIMIGCQKPGPLGAVPVKTVSSVSVNDRTLRRCCMVTSGPIATAGSSGSPTVHLAAALANISTNRSNTDRSTSTLLRAQQSCPELSNTAPGAAAAAASRSASANTMLALLPPSSSVTRFTCSAQPAMMRLPTAVDPVNAILRTSGCSTIRQPTSSPVPTTTLRTPGGMPASRASSPNRIVVSGVISAGLMTAVLPDASAGPIFHDAIITGKFQGVMRPTTPNGSLKVTLTPPATGMVEPVCLSIAPAK